MAGGCWIGWGRSSGKKQVGDGRLESFDSILDLLRSLLV